MKKWINEIVLFQGLLCISIQGLSIDLEGVLVEDRLVVGGGHVVLPCPGGVSTRVEWRCRGCFSISETKETIVAELVKSRPENLVFPDRIHLVPGDSGYNLEINPCSTQDSGKYFCLLNKEAKPRVVYNLAVQDVASTPGKPLIMSFNSTAVNLSWAPPLQQHHAPVSTYLIQILEGENTNWASYTTISTDSPETTYTVPNLKPFTVYSFRVIGKNKIGPSPASLPSYHMMTLREAPRGKPTILNTRNLSSSSIQLEWRAPDLDSINGEFIGYRISWKPRTSSNRPQFLDLKDPGLLEYRLTGLKAFTFYLISLQVMNPEGLGPPASVTVTTDEGVPSNPVNLTIITITNSGLIMQWNKPEAPNGNISGYRLFYAAEQFTNVKTINSSADIVTGEIDGLDAYRKYHVFVKAFNSRNEGNSSETIQVMSDVTGPGKVVLSNLTCPDEKSVYIEWSKPDTFFHSVDRYRVYYRRKDEDSWRKREIIVPPVPSGSPPERILLVNLTEGQEYSVYVQGYTQSLYRENLQYPGDTSEILHVIPGRDCNRVQVSPMREGGAGRLGASHGIILGCLAVILVLLIAVVSLAYWRRSVMKKRFYIPAYGGCSHQDEIMWDIQVGGDESGRTCVQAGGFLQHVQLLHAEGDSGFHEEYQNIKQGITGNPVLRVQSPGKPVSMKIYNLDSFQSRSSYLYLPEPWSLDPTEFWMFINKSGTNTIVSVDTELDNLFPREPQTFGSLDILPGAERSHPSFSTRQFNIDQRRGKKNGSSMHVNLVEYTSSTRSYRGDLDFLRFIRVADNIRKSGKTVVLSGKSLVYMIVDTLNTQLESRNNINIPAYIRYLGSCTRIDELTFREFILVYDVMCLAVQSKGSNISTKMITQVLEEPFMEKQFSVCTEVPGIVLQYTAALSPVHQDRNNSLDYVCVDWSRVVLDPVVEGVDYVNASWTPGYSGPTDFIISQHPVPNTLHQFWSMVWQTGTKIIVCLSVIPHQFWPVIQVPLILPGLRVWLDSEGSLGGYRSTQLVLQCGDVTTSVQLISCPNWPHQSVPVSNCVHLVDCVNKQLTSGPVLVVDSYGATEAAIFVTLSSLVRQMDTESAVDLFYWFKAVHLSRPGVWISPDNLFFLYRVLAELCSINPGRK